MADEINPAPNNKNSSNQGFVTKQVDSSAYVAAPAVAQPVGFKGFYKANKFYFWAIILGVLIIGTLAYFAFKEVPQAPLKEANVQIEVKVPEQVPSGSEAVYTITLQNKDSQKLVGAELELAYSEGMTFISSGPSSFQPKNLSATLFPVPDLLPGQNTPLFLKLKVTGNVSDRKTLNIKLHYKYANFNSEFIKQESSTVTLTASAVLIELQGPATTNNAQLVIYNIKYQNTSDGDLKSARVKMQYPDGFVFASASPSPSLSTDTWDLGSLAKAAEGEIQVQGTFTANNPGESKTATASFLILGNDGQFFTQNSSSFTTSITSLPLLVSQELDSDNPSGIINPGDSLTVRVRYQNNASLVANGVNITVTLDSKVADLSSLRAEAGQINNNSITWNAATVPQLERLAPNDAGQLSFSVKINNPATKDSSKNLTLVSDVKIKSDEYDSFLPGNQLTLKVSSPAAISKALSFVSGQFPPQVGRSTTYKVRLTLSNSSNDFSNGSLTAFIPLPPGGFLSSSITPAESSKVQFDPSTGKLTWNVGNLPANTGRFGPARILEFQLMLNPSASQANQVPTLVKNINFTARDIFTLQDISLSATDITTDHAGGENSFGNGTVQP
jgi:hypothetical protein